MKKLNIIRANILYAPELGKLTVLPRGYMVVAGGVIEGVYQSLPDEYMSVVVEDFGDKILIPSFCDMHLHAPQYSMMGMGMNLPLIDWLNTYAFKAETQFSDEGFAREIYANLARGLIAHGTTRVAMFSSIHINATHILIEELEKAGVSGYVGKVNMDRNCCDALKEDTAESLKQTREFIVDCKERYHTIHPILTPRFSPSCTDELMRGLGELKEEFRLRVQTHMSENDREIEWVSELYPDIKDYWESYDKFGLFERHTLLAHCVSSTMPERNAIRDRGAWVVHCPDSNINLSSGNAPIRTMLDEGVLVALGTDVAGGASISMMNATTMAVRASKQRTIQFGEKPLSFIEAFYLATSAGAIYFGDAPGFAKGNRLNALILDDSSLPNSDNISLTDRLERLFYTDDKSNIVARFALGEQV